VAEVVADLITEARRRAGEALLPELEPYLVDSPLGQCLKHPWVFDVPYWPSMAWRCNDQYRAKREAVRQAMAEKKWPLFVQLHERPYRRSALWEIRPLVNSQEYWELLGYVWTDSENTWQWGCMLPQLLGSRRTGRECIMLEEEREALAVLPEELVVHRGLTSRGTTMGWSWTLSQPKAEWFARRLLDSRKGEKPILMTATVAKSRVIAHFTRRGEAEIVTNPRYLRNIRETVLDVGQPA